MIYSFSDFLGIIFIGIPFFVGFVYSAFYIIYYILDNLPEEI